MMGYYVFLIICTPVLPCKEWHDNFSPHDTILQCEKRMDELDEFFKRKAMTDKRFIGFHFDTIECRKGSFDGKKAHGRDA